MAFKPTTEPDFEAAIEAWLVDQAGYFKVDHKQFDTELALDPATIISFIKDSQEATYNKLAASYGEKNIEGGLVKRIASECDSRGLLDVVRNGVKDRGQHVQLAYFRPPTTLNPETEKLYAKNRLTVMRQVHFDSGSNSSIDILLSLNGLPIATVELKNAFTGQKTINAVKQYIKDRIPSPKTPLIQYKKRALVHFAVDTDEVYLATRLYGDSTFFLPFNTGNHGGKGNPSDHSYKTGYKTGYLWEEVWQRDSWLDIIHRFNGVLGGVLGNEELNDETTLSTAEKDDSANTDPPTLEDLVIEEAKSRGKQPNISFYAFTATPKKKTLEMFGVPGSDGKPHPFHLYSMRQAIEEKFILDVLKHYTTYNSYFNLSKAITDDPELDEKKAKKAIARFMSLHPHNIAQKTEIMVEHFRNFTMKKIGGRAKAMVVTRSRLHAVRYKRHSINT